MALMRHIGLEQFSQRLKLLLQDGPFSSLYHDALLNPLKIAVCVSGGPDSMALAYLLKHARHHIDSEMPLFDAYAIVVDHGARVGSADEAAHVQTSLTSLGIKSSVLQLHWSDGISPSNLRHFETEARRKRYRTISRNALQQSARAIFAGHHEDDQVETILMRIAQMHDSNTLSSRLALRGIVPISPVPCCEHLFETQQTSTRPVYSQGTVQQRGIPFCSEEKVPVSTHHSPNPLQIYRPLLSYTKQEILATCQFYSIPYVTDETNADPSITVRNAVRHLRSTFKLPQALQRDRLMRLQTLACNDLDRVRTKSDELKNLLKIHPLSTNSPAIAVEFPIDLVRDCLETHPDALAFAFARITESISPLPGDKFPVLLSRKTAHRLVMSSYEEFAHFNDQKVCFTPSSTGEPEAEQRRWILSRQPMRKQEILFNTVFLETERTQQDGSQTSTWVLWDNRFWIRVFVSNKLRLFDIRLRPYNESDVQLLNTVSLERSTDKKRLKSILNQGSPGKIRFTLPVLEHQGQIVAFPSLNIQISLSDTVGFEIRHPCKPRVYDFFANLKAAHT